MYHHKSISRIKLIIVPLAIVLFKSSIAQHNNIEAYEFISPMPGSSMILPESTIIIREGNLIDENSLDNLEFIVKGSKSGDKNCDVILARDSKTIILRPDIPFKFGEKVDVKFSCNLKTMEGKELLPIQFSFNITERIFTENKATLKESVKYENKLLNKIKYKKESEFIDGIDELPEDFPEITITISDNPSPESIFMTPYTYPSLSFSYLLILDNNGVPVYYLRVPRHTNDFKVQHNDSLTFYDFASFKFIELNSSYAIIDSFSCGNGYPTDDHDFLLFPDGHSFLMSYDWQPVRMDTIVPGGDSSAIVIGLIVQELDENKNVIFQWRSWDHFQITDATEDIDLTAHTIDYVHGNAIELTQDGNLLISSRHLDEITKINRQTGEIIWRLGGLNARNNNFQFINDPITFSHQHDIRELANGNLTLFDNGNLHNPQFSRSLEYEIDEVNMIANLVWDYNYNPPFYSPATGSSRRLDNGNTLIGWGLIEGKTISEVKRDGTIALDMALADSFRTYRVLKFPWRTKLFITNPDSIFFTPVAVGDSSSIFINVISNSSNDINITGFYHTEVAYFINHTLPFTIPPFGNEHLEIKFKPIEEGYFRDTLHLRIDTDTSRIVQIVDIVGITDSIYLGIDINNSSDGFSLEQNFPNPFNPTTKIKYRISKNGFVILKVFDVLGKEVETLVDEEKQTGEYEIIFSSENLSSGIYFYKLQVYSSDNKSERYSAVKKMTILK